MSNGYGFGGDQVKEESSWRYPIGIFFATIVLCVIFLYYYLGPSVDEFKGDLPSPSITEEEISVQIASHTFAPAANYTVYPRGRRGGRREELTLYALWPTLDGYTPANRREFVDDDPRTRRIYITIAERNSRLTESDRLETLYLPSVQDRRGIRTPYQLTKYTFEEARSNVPTNGYAGTELFVGADSEENTIVLFCFEERDDIPSPECWRSYEFSNDVTITYRFKRPYLPEWRAIDEKIRAFVGDLNQ